MTPRLRYAPPAMHPDFAVRSQAKNAPLIPRTRSKGGDRIDWGYAPELKDEGPTRKAAPFDIAPSAEEPGRRRKYADRVCEDCLEEYAPKASNQKRCLACSRQAKAIQRAAANAAKAEATRVKRERLLAMLASPGTRRLAEQEIDADTRNRARLGQLNKQRKAS